MKEYWPKWYDKNKKKHIARQPLIQKKIAEYIRKVKTVPCKDCKLRYPYYVMQFDHVRGKKLFLISGSYHGKGFQQVKREISKCEIVCANCHAIRSWNNSWGLSDNGSTRPLQG